MFVLKKGENKNGENQDTIKAGKEKPVVRAYQGLCQAALGQPVEARASLEQALENAGADIRVLRTVRDGYHILRDSSREQELKELIGKKGKPAGSNE